MKSDYSARKRGMPTMSTEERLKSHMMINPVFQELADKYGVAKKTIMNAIKGVTWKCVPYFPAPPKEESYGV